MPKPVRKHKALTKDEVRRLTRQINAACAGPPTAEDEEIRRFMHAALVQLVKRHPY